MSVCFNLGLDRPGRLAVYAGYVVLCACLRVQRAHQCALGIADPLSSSHSFNECLCQFSARSAQPFGRLYWTGQDRKEQNVTETILETYNIDIYICTRTRVSRGLDTNSAARRITIAPVSV
jgi:hypothetical protein